MKEFVKLPFVLRIADDTSANIATVGSQTGRIPLPPSFKASRVKEFQYMWVLLFKSSTSFKPVFQPIENILNRRWVWELTADSLSCKYEIFTFHDCPLSFHCKRHKKDITVSVIWSYFFDFHWYQFNLQASVGPRNTCTRISSASASECRSICPASTFEPLEDCITLAANQNKNLLSTRIFWKSNTQEKSPCYSVCRLQPVPPMHNRAPFHLLPMPSGFQLVLVLYVRPEQDHGMLLSTLLSKSTLRGTL